jgi:hypothetical protein
VEHVKTGCERGHWFTPTADSLHHLRAEEAERLRRRSELTPAP